MFKARMYLDFDGVINTDKPQFDNVSSFTVTTKDSGMLVTHRVVYSPDVVAMLERFRTEYNVELVWLTTWNEDLAILKAAKKMDALLGGRVLHGVINRRVDTNREWTRWKADNLRADQKGDALPFAWVDDEAIKYHKKDVLAATEGTSSLLVEPRDYWGLTRSLLTRMESFFAAL